MGARFESAEIRVAWPGGNALFMANIHTRATLGELALDWDRFYRRCGGQIPKFPHCEIEVISPSRDLALQRRLHVYGSEGNGGGIYVCYPSAIADRSSAKQVLKAWCADSAVRLVDPKVNLTDWDKECGGDLNQVVVVAKKRYQVVIVSETYH